MISKSQSLKRKQKSSEGQQHDGSCKKTKDVEWERRMEGFRGLDLGNTSEGPASADIEWDVSEEESDADFNHGEIEIEASKSESEDDCDISSTPTSQKQPITEDQLCFKAEKCAGLNKLSCSSSQEIDSASLSPPSQSQVHTKTTPSAWLKNLQWKPTSPEKSWQYNEEELDSAKKKRLKHCREGLAERLHKLTAREKSSQRFWAHSLTTSSKEEEEGVLSVQIMSARNYHSLLWTSCSSLTTTGQSQQLGSQFSVVFNTQQDIRVGSQVRIYPPWKKINLPSGALILCSRFRQTACASTAAPIDVPSQDMCTDSQ